MASMKSYADVFLSPSTQRYISTNTVVGVWWHKISAQFWSPDLWLPEGVEWIDLRSTKDFVYPESKDIFVYPLMFSIVVIVIKQFLIDPFILSPLANMAGISSKRAKPPVQNNILERIFETYGANPPYSGILEAAHSLEVSERKIERWLRHRHLSSLCTKYDKFLDCGFELITHTAMCICGMIIMYNKPWLWNIHLCWHDYPRHSISSDLWWYYMIGSSHYWAATFVQAFFATGKKSDANQMLLHHFITIILMAFSWSINFVRVGTLVLMVHECADIPLLSAKMCKYAGIKAPTDVLFAVFLFVWVYTRCYLYPIWILRSVFVDGAFLDTVPVILMCKGLLAVLLILNLIWTALIAGIIIKKITGGSLEDIRSDVEELCDSDEEVVKIKDD